MHTQNFSFSYLNNIFFFRENSIEKWIVFVVSCSTFVFHYVSHPHKFQNHLKAYRQLLLIEYFLYSYVEFQFWKLLLLWNRMCILKVMIMPKIKYSEVCKAILRTKHYTSYAKLLTKCTCKQWQTIEKISFYLQLSTTTEKRMFKLLSCMLKTEPT